MVSVGFESEHVHNALGKLEFVFSYNLEKGFSRKFRIKENEFQT
jgi:hypothetical protein